MNWHKRLQNILKNDIKSRPIILDDLKQEIISKIHGNTNIKTKIITELLNNICTQYRDKLGDLELEITESNYNNNKEKNMDTSFLHIKIDIKGVWNGFVYFETSAGTRNSTGEPIYYIMQSDFKIKSNLEEKIKDYYINTYKLMVEKEFLDLAVNKNMYLQLNTKRYSYELWDKKPLDYSDTMSGDYKYNYRYDDKYSKRYLKTYDMYKTLRKIKKADSLKEFIESKTGDGVGYETQKVEWRNYYI